MADINLDAQALLNEAAQLHAELVRRCIFLAGQVGALQAELKAMKDEKAACCKPD